MLNDESKKAGTKTGVFAPSYHDKPITSLELIEINLYSFKR